MPLARRLMRAALHVLHVRTGRPKADERSSGPGRPRLATQLTCHKADTSVVTDDHYTETSQASDSRTPQLRSKQWAVPQLYSNSTVDPTGLHYAVQTECLYTVTISFVIFALVFLT